MTAIKKYERLEAMGLWREFGNTQRIEVVVSFGDTTLVLSDIQNRPLTHWSLAAIERLRRTENGVIYTADPNGDETLEIDDPLMIDAIDHIQRMIDGTRPHPGQLRRYLSWGILLISLILFALWLPGNITRYAASITTPATAKNLGSYIQTAIERSTGSICETPATRQALHTLNQRLKAPPDSIIYIAQLGPQQAISLPGNVIILDADFIRAAPNPAVIAGYVLAQRARQKARSATQHLFQVIGLQTTFRFLASGEIEPEALDKFANSLLLDPPLTPDPTDLSLLFAIAEVPTEPYAQQLGISLPQQDNNGSDHASPPILSDAQFQALQNACSR